MNFTVECSSGVIEIKVSNNNVTFASLRVTKTKLNVHKRIQFRDHSGQSIENFRVSLSKRFESFQVFEQFDVNDKCKMFLISQKVVFAKLLSFEVKMFVVSYPTPGSPEDYLIA